MYGRADGMPSFQLTVAVCAWITTFSQCTPDNNDEATSSLDELLPAQVCMSIRNEL
jgi:hypothetical protein